MHKQQDLWYLKCSANAWQLERLTISVVLGSFKPHLQQEGYHLKVHLCSSAVNWYFNKGDLYDMVVKASKNWQSNTCNTIDVMGDQSTTKTGMIFNSTQSKKDLNGQYFGWYQGTPNMAPAHWAFVFYRVRFEVNNLFNGFYFKIWIMYKPLFLSNLNIFEHKEGWLTEMDGMSLIIYLTD